MTFLGRFVHWAVDTSGSSRTSALIRIGLVFLVWSRWAPELRMFAHFTPAGISFGLVFFAASILMLVGYRTRLTTSLVAVLCFLLYYFGGYVMGNAGWTSHHVYLLSMACLLSTMTPAGKSWSVDRWLAIRSAENAATATPLESGNLWGLRLMTIQMSALYFWTAFDKTHVGWLSGDRLEQLFLTYYTHYWLPDWPGWFMQGLAIIVWALEYALAFGLLLAVTRKWLIIPGILMHLLFYYFLSVGTFSLTCILLYLAYLNADHVHAVIDKLNGHVPREIAAGST